MYFDIFTNMSSIQILIVISLYFGVLLLISKLTSKNDNNLDFFKNKSGVSPPETKRVVHGYGDLLFNRSEGCVI